MDTAPHFLPKDPGLGCLLPQSVWIACCFTVRLAMMPKTWTSRSLWDSSWQDSSNLIVVISKFGFWTTPFMGNPIAGREIGIFSCDSCITSNIAEMNGEILCNDFKQDTCCSKDWSYRKQIPPIHCRIKSQITWLLKQTLWITLLPKPLWQPFLKVIR